MDLRNGVRMVTFAVLNLAATCVMGADAKADDPARHQKAVPPQLQRGSCELVMPPSSIRNGESGVVQVGVMVSDAGVVMSTRILRSSGFPGLDEETAKQLVTCKYAPAIDPLGEPIAAMALVNLEWK